MTVRSDAPRSAAPLAGQKSAKKLVFADGSGKVSGSEQGMRVLSYLIGGMLFYGGVGWLIDHFAGTSFAMPVGIVVGMACSIFLIIRRFGGDGSVKAPTKTEADFTTETDRSNGEEDRWQG